MTYSITLNKGMNHYSNEIKRLIRDLMVEIEGDVKDGIAHMLSTSQNDEVGTYNFLKTEGYDINYKDYQEFHEDCMDIIETNLDEIERMVRAEENSNVELSDEQLETVAGGGLKSFWKKHKKKIIVGAVIVVAVAAVATITVATCGVGTAAAGAGAATVASEVALPIAARTSAASASKIAWLTGSALILL